MRAFARLAVSIGEGKILGEATHNIQPLAFSHKQHERRNGALRELRRLDLLRIRPRGDTRRGRKARAAEGVVKRGVLDAILRGSPDDGLDRDPGFEVVVDLQSEVLVSWCGFERGSGQGRGALGTRRRPCLYKAP